MSRYRYEGIASAVCFLTVGIAGIFCLSAFWKINSYHTRISKKMCLTFTMHQDINNYLSISPASLVDAPLNCNQNATNIISLNIPSPLDEPTCCSGKAIWILYSGAYAPDPTIPICFGSGMIIIVAIVIVIELITYFSKKSISPPNTPAIIIISEA